MNLLLSEQDAGSMSKLPAQLLQNVLQRLNPADRLGSAALVNTSFNTAAAMATHEVHVHCNTALELTRLSSLSAWLSAHNSTAPLGSIVASSNADSESLLMEPSLQLPFAELTQLQHLYLRNVLVTDTYLQRPIFLADLLTALTHLELHRCPELELRHMRAATQLQHLVYASDTGEYSATSITNITEISQALSWLVSLTHFDWGIGDCSH